MKIATAKEMQKIDRITIEEVGIPGVILMERAGLAVALKIQELFSPKKVIVLSGSGNNGGDGFVVARYLHNEGWDVKAFVSVKEDDLKGDALLQYKTAIKCGVNIYPITRLLAEPSSIVTRHSIIVDAILGTGLRKNITGILAECINLLNNLKVPIVSVDIPSGISSDDGQVMGKAVKADYTITFGLPKRGHFLYPGFEYTGKLLIEDIGFPSELLSSEELRVDLLEKKDMTSLIPERLRYSHKGNYGHVLIVAGSSGKTGAAFMTAKACLRTGAGLVTLGIPESLSDVFQSRVTEEMTLILPDRGNGTLSSKALNKILDFMNENADVIAIGPGIGVSSDTEKLVKVLIQKSLRPVVIDADGINSIKGDTKILAKARSPIILTPHPGEMARLLSQKSEERELRDKIEKNRINAALSFSKDTGTYLVLKGIPTIVSTPDQRSFINPTGNPGMATGGTGDVLTGMIGGFLSQMKIPLNACILGVYMHGLAGDIAACEKGQHSLLASDIIDKISDAFISLTCNG